MMEEKPNCYKCKFRGTIPGSYHSCCRHLDSGKLNIKGNPHGIENGWFIWPVNFDPIWLESCDGFILKEEK